MLQALTLGESAGDFVQGLELQGTSLHACTQRGRYSCLQWNPATSQLTPGLQCAIGLPEVTALAVRGDVVLAVASAGVFGLSTK